MGVTAKQGRAWGLRIVASLVVLLIADGICAAAYAQRSSASAALAGEMFSSGGRAVPGGSVGLRSGQLVPGDSVTASVGVDGARRATSSSGRPPLPGTPVRATATWRRRCA